MREIGSRTVAPGENCPPALILTLTLNQTLTLIGGAIFLGGNFPESREITAFVILLQQIKYIHTFKSKKKSLNLYFPVFPFDPPENIRKPLVF